MKIKRIIIFFIVLLFLALLSYYYPQIQSLTTGKLISNNNVEYPKEPAIVTRIVDGDTIHAIVNGKDETIRLLGINTPEKNKPNSDLAKDFLFNELINRSVELLRDKTDTDRYSRKLRYVFLNNRIMNIEIIENGYATTFMLDGLLYKDKFVTAEKLAKDNGLGLWKTSQDICNDCIKLKKLDPIKDFFIINNVCTIDCDLSGWEVKDDANHFTKLNSLESGEEKTYGPGNTEIWNDDHDRFFMRDKDGLLVVFYSY